MLASNKRDQVFPYLPLDAKHLLWLNSCFRSHFLTNNREALLELQGVLQTQGWREIPNNTQGNKKKDQLSIFVSYNFWMFQLLVLLNLYCFLSFWKCQQSLKIYIEKVNH